jgi:hypothetical protein
MLGRPAGVICYVCALSTTHGVFVGEGRGAREVAQDQDLNKAIKMAQKSAQVDAILRIGALSDSFTQDLEDQHPPHALTMRAQKRRIVALLQQLGLGTADKAGYEEAVQQHTALPLVPAHYPEIIHRLERGVQEHGSREAGRARHPAARPQMPAPPQPPPRGGAEGIPGAHGQAPSIPETLRPAREEAQRLRLRQR